MKTVQTGDKLIIQENPFVLWTFGLFFIFVGAAFVYISLANLSIPKGFFTFPVLLCFLMGLIGVGTGIWLIHHSPHSRLIIDRDRQRVIFTKYALFGKDQFVFDFDEISFFMPVEDIDTDNDSYWYPAIELATGEKVRISSQAHPTDKIARAQTLQINDFMQKQMPKQKNVLSIKDENPDKMS